MVNKRLINTGAEAAPAAFDPLQNFETVTYTGNGSTQKITGYIRKGAAFNGSSSIFYVNSFDTTTNFSISLWFKTSSSNYQVLANNGGGESTNTGFLWYLNTSGNIVLSTSSGGGTFGGTPTTSAYNDGNWHNSVLNYASNGVYSIYVDNQLVVSETSSRYTGASVAGRPFAIGAWSQLNQWWFNGSIDQVRIFNTALNPTQVGQLALETYADPKKSTTDYFGNGSGVALYELDEDALSSNFEQAAVFNGSSSYITTSLDFDNLTDYSISMWIYISAAPSPSDIFAGTIQDSGALNGFYLSVQTDRTIRFFERNGSTNASSLTSTDTINVGSWNHLLAVRNGSTNLLYINNGTAASTSNGTITHAEGFTIGRGGAHTSSLFNGKIDQVRIYSSVLDSTDVQKLYKESADVPTTNLVAHYKLDGNAEDVLDTYDGTASNVTYSAGVYGGTPTNVNFLGMAFQPDLVWIKVRDASTSHALVDSVRGRDSVIYSNVANQEATSNSSNDVVSFDSNGFTLGADQQANANTNGNDIVAWCWKAGGSVTPNNNTNGTIPSTVSANPDAGFSVVKYTTPSGGSGTVGHGLSTTPEIYITKRTDSTSDWYFNTTAIDGSLDYLVLNTTAVKTDSSGITAPTPTVFSASNFGTQDEEWISYCFHSVDGYQRVGSYLGTGLAGNIVYTDSNGDGTGTGAFRPRFVMWKAAIRPSGGGSWYIYDSTRTTSNPQGQYLQANEPAQELDGTSVFSMDFNSNGFTINATNNEINQSGSTYIYLAIA